jgi:hypothetical protein
LKLESRFGVSKIATPLFDFAAGEPIRGKGARGYLTAQVASRILEVVREYRYDDHVYETPKKMGPISDVGWVVRTKNT